MKRTYLFVILCPIALVLLVGLATNRESWSEMNRPTGAMRTRTTGAFLFFKPRVETPTWVSERAAQLGLGTDSERQLLTHRQVIWGVTTRSCGSAPASFLLRSTDESVLSAEQQEEFVRNFVKADEIAREAMIRDLSKLTP